MVTHAKKKSDNIAGAFLDLPPEASRYDTARAVVLPLPLEESVSYGGGTAGGPAAIIEASRQVELFDARSGREPAMEYGVHTLPPPDCFDGTGHGIPALLDAVGDEIARHLRSGKFVVGLGGEHTVSLAVAKGVAAEGDFTLVHIDAHADLRDSYEDNPYSHACVVRRITELPECENVMQLGIRSTSRDQVDYAVSKGIKTMYAWDMHANRAWRDDLAAAVAGRRVFLTFDVDGLDPAIVPATGTPEPNGLTWEELMTIAAVVSHESAACVAMDCVELAPVPSLHHADFTVARALYEIMTQMLEKK